MLYFVESKNTKISIPFSILFCWENSIRWVLVIILLVCSSALIGQTNVDSLLLLWQSEVESDSVRLDALRKIYAEEYLVSNPDSAFILAETAFNFAANKSLQKEMETAEYSMKLAKKISKEQIKREAAFQSVQTTLKYQFFALFLGMAMILLGSLFYLKNRNSESLSERKNLLQKIELLNEKLVAQSVSSEQKRKELGLDRAKIEKSINTKIGESSWRILNFIFKNPSSSNKEIAEEVDLSVEGVSSSLRRMYVAFGIKRSGSKKVLLMMEAVRISIEE